MNTLPQAELDALTKLASFICQTPIALISLTSDNGQAFITRLGPATGETSQEIAFCQQVVLSGPINIIEDTTANDTYKADPLVTGAPFIRFFAGLPLINNAGKQIGALYVLGKAAKTFTSDQKDALTTLGTEITTKYELHKQNEKIELALANKEKELQPDQDLIDYKYALDKSSMVSIFGLDGIITYVNDKFCEISSYSCEEIIGKDHRILNPELHSKEFIKDLWNKIAKGDIYQSEFKNKAKDGTYFWVSATIIPFLDEHGKPYKYLSISYDVTQKKIQEQQLQEVRMLADKLSKSKDSFMTNMSHEIRTPLNAITGLGKLLSKSKLDDQQRNYLDGIESASENLLSVVNDLLDFSKIEAGKITIEHISFNFAQTCQQSINILTHKAEEKGLELACKIDEKINPILMGDPYRINQVFMNMLGNAIKFTEQGYVRMHATLLEDAEAWQKIQIEIEDTGVGINEEYLDNIFDKFTQEDETVVRKFGGTGLGMSISKELMELMDGVISVRSKKDKGTTITLIFTLKKGTTRVLEKKRTIKNETSNIDNKRILLVEDNSLNRLLAKTILADYGAVITEAENGAIAVDLMRKQQFDIILMDVQMPVMDGIQATQIIRKEINATIPIIALTANGIKGKLDQFIEAGMDDHIFKPYDELKLVNPIAKWLKTNTPEEVPDVPRITVVTKVTAKPQVVPVAVQEITTPPPPEAPEVKLYDLTKLMEMSNNNDDFIMKMLTLFVNEIPPSVKKIVEAYGNGDLPSIKYYSHMLKPSILNLGIAEVKTEIVQIEATSERGENSAELGKMIEKLDRVITQVVIQMKDEYGL
ncbi:MAG: Histidine kinase [Flavipsychrobacter sp.]|nr:Histidine kinase [Flavipsychrobacter sp.]